MRRLAPGVAVFTSRAAALMTSSVILNGTQALLIDPGVLPDELWGISRFLAEHGAVVSAIVLTHHHWDHVLGTRLWPSARRFGHRSLPEWLDKSDAYEPFERSVEAALQLHGFEPPVEIRPLALTDCLDGNAELQVGELRARLLHLPGHAGDAMGVLLESERILFSADMLDPNELPMPHQDVDVYLGSLARIEELLKSGEVTRVVPGHGWPLETSEQALTRLRLDRDYLQRLRDVAAGARERGESFETAWPRFQIIPYLGKGDRARDEEHRYNAKIIVERLGAPGR